MGAVTDAEHDIFADGIECNARIDEVLLFHVKFLNKNAFRSIPNNRRKIVVLVCGAETLYSGAHAHASTPSHTLKYVRFYRGEIAYMKNAPRQSRRRRRGLRLRSMFSLKLLLTVWCTRIRMCRLSVPGSVSFQFPGATTIFLSFSCRFSVACVVLCAFLCANSLRRLHYMVALLVRCTLISYNFFHVCVKCMYEHELKSSDAPHPQTHTHTRTHNNASLSCYIIRCNTSRMHIVSGHST